jgi:hypothetical protein
MKQTQQLEIGHFINKFITAIMDYLKKDIEYENK